MTTARAFAVPGDHTRSPGSGQSCPDQKSIPMDPIIPNSANTARNDGPSGLPYPRPPVSNGASSGTATRCPSRSPSRRHTDDGEGGASSNPATRRPSSSGDAIQAAPKTLPPSDDSAAQATLNTLPTSAGTNEIPNYRPLVLQDKMLCICLAFLLVCFGLIALAFTLDTWAVDNLWTYVFFVILPYVLGTLSSIWLESIVQTLSRIMPFILCASSDGALARNALFQKCFPIPSLRDAWRSRPWFLVLSHVIWWMTALIVPLKASFLSSLLPNPSQKVYEWKFFVIRWAAMTLMAFYICFALFIVILAVYLHHRRTGLPENDVRTIADTIAMTQNPKLLRLFAGTGGATRDSMMAAERFNDKRIKLGFWRHEDDRFDYGLFPVSRDPETADETSDTDESNHRLFSKKELDKISRASVYSFANPISVDFQMAFWTAALLMGAYITALFVGRTRSNEFPVPLSVDVAELVFVFLPTTMLEIFLSFWSDMRLFAAMTQPYVAMRQEGGGSPHDTLMLEYASRSALEQVTTALMKSHWKVALTGMASVAHRLLPLLAGPSLLILNDSTLSSGGSLVRMNVPLVATVTLWMGLELILIPLVVLKGSDTRALPRDQLCIGEIISWTDTSDIRQQPEFDRPALQTVAARCDRTWQECMGAQLTQATWKVRFGVVPATGSEGQYAIGIGTVTIDLSDDDQLKLPLLGAQHFKMATGSEDTVADGFAERIPRIMDNVDGEPVDEPGQITSP